MNLRKLCLLLYEVPFDLLLNDFQNIFSFLFPNFLLDTQLDVICEQLMWMLFSSKFSLNQKS